jgi:hypothetical protein
MGWTIGVPGFDSRRRLGIFLFITATRPAPGPTQPPIQWVPGALSLGIKRPGCEADHSPPSSAEVKECVEVYLHSINTPSRRGAQFKKRHRDNVAFTFMCCNLQTETCCGPIPVQGVLPNVSEIHRFRINSQLEEDTRQNLSQLKTKNLVTNGRHVYCLFPFFRVLTQVTTMKNDP